MSVSTGDDFLSVDLDNLDLDCQEHAKLVRTWGRALAAASAKAKEARNKARVVQADLRALVRANPQNYGIEPGSRGLTVDQVDDFVESSREYQQAKREVLLAEQQEDLIKTNTVALRERGERIADLVKLHGQMYWAAPRSDPVTRERYMSAKKLSADNDASKAAGEPIDNSPKTLKGPAKPAPKKK